MSSLQAVEPKRERGRLRVEAILDAAAEVIASKGFAAATMTEVAARSHTAIGSLYRFFPTKDVLADALSRRFLADIGERFQGIEAAAGGQSPAALAGALFDLMIDLRRGKAAVLALMEVLGEADARRAAVRERVVGGIAATLRIAAPKLTEKRRDAAAVTVLHFLRGVTRIMDDGTAVEARLAELRHALTLYLADLTAATRGP